MTRLHRFVTPRRRYPDNTDDKTRSGSPLSRCRRTLTKCIAALAGTSSLPPFAKRPLSIVPRRSHRVVPHVKISVRTQPSHPCTRTLRARLSMTVSVDECAVAMLVVHGYPTESLTATVPPMPSSAERRRGRRLFAKSREMWHQAKISQLGAGVGISGDAILRSSALTD